jgi:hypothetical protein
VTVARKPRIVGKASGFNPFGDVMPRFMTITCDNGLPLKAPVEVCIAGLMQILDPEQKRNLFEVVGKITGGGVL